MKIIGLLLLLLTVSGCRLEAVYRDPATGKRGACVGANHGVTLVLYDQCKTNYEVQGWVREP